MLKTVWDITNDDFIKHVNESKNYTKTIKKRINLLNLSIDHFVKNVPPITVAKELKDILIEGITHNGTYLKKRLIKELNWEYKCDECGISECNGKKITLELDHINGIHTDNRIENLRLQCPNCHSQTPTFRTKNKATVESRKCGDCPTIILQVNKSGYCIKCIAKYRKPLKDKPSLKELEKDMKELKTYVAVGKKHNVSDNCIRKWIQKYNQKELVVKSLNIDDMTI